MLVDKLYPYCLLSLFAWGMLWDLLSDLQVRLGLSVDSCLSMAHTTLWGRPWG